MQASIVIRRALLFFVLFSLACCSSKESREKKAQARPFNERIILESSIHERREAAWMYLQQGKADSAISYSFDLVTEAESNQTPDELVVDAYLHLGSVLLNAGARDLAEVYLAQAIQRYHSFGFGPSGYLRHLYAISASTFYTRQKYREAIRYFHKAQAVLEEMDQPLYVASMLNNLGLVYLETGQLDSARYYFLGARQLFEEENLPFDELVFSMANNLADVAYRQGDYQSSRELYRENYVLASAKLGSYEGAPKRMVTSNLGMAKTSLAQGQMDTATLQLERAAKYLAELEVRPRSELQGELLRLKRDLVWQQGSMENYHSLTRQVETLADSLQQQQMGVMALATENMAGLQLQINRLRLKAEKDSLRFNQLLTLGLLLLFALVGGFLVTLVRKRSSDLAAQKKLALADQRNRQLEEEKLRLQLQNQGKDLNELSAHTSFLRKLTREAREKLKNLRHLDEEAQKAELHGLSTLFNQRVSEGKVRAMIQENLHEVNSLFFGMLEEKSIIKLSKKEKELCALFRLNLNDGQIADMRGISINAVQVARFRIKKKFGLQKEDDLSVFLAGL